LGLSTKKGPAWKHHLRPLPQLDEGRRLRTSKVRSAMDLSDGLSTDLHRMAKASGLSAILDGSIPIFPGASLEQALHGGEDYQLLFATRKPSRHHRIGTFIEGRPGMVLYQGKPLVPAGYDHFSS
jgi:thiamine-monophosphate kinase